MDQETRKAFVELTATVERGFAAVADDIAKLDRRVARVEERVVRLDERLVGLDERVANIERELSGIRRDLDQLSDKVDNTTGYRKEIDHALERIARIERHLGLDKKIAA